ncbi:hypothetical protein, unlikely [Trypanosoma brucei brucei TREU927]|uniref:Uncharacterized protein n=1 Tax=Trypanosoma brucei brucei (strain 927/4 GUTat10.1) TaxID=185431 RepID=Q38CX7_TRYB2|nr:hypothetical protein, unlikely [Trypanosoma brucei brucei TREU927]EAN77343.1 hypothetical protein, unlikely [Trypanosoma brucei brucei TREU927]
MFSFSFLFLFSFFFYYSLFRSVRWRVFRIKNFFFWRGEGLPAHLNQLLPTHRHCSIKVD